MGEREDRVVAAERIGFWREGDGEGDKLDRSLPAAKRRGFWREGEGDMLERS